MPEPMSDERLAAIDEALDKAGDVVTEMDDYGLKANTHWIGPLVFGLLGAKELRAEVERLRAESAVRRDLLHETRAKLERAQRAGREVQDELDKALTERNAARGEVERLREEERRQRESAEAAKNGWLKAVNEVERLRAELARWEGHDALTKTLVAQAEAERDAARRDLTAAYAVLCEVMPGRPATVKAAAEKAAKVIRGHAAERRRVLAERDRLAEQVKRVRNRHRPVVRNLDDDEATEVAVCLECDGIREKHNDETAPDPYPCPTIGDLDPEATP